LKKAIFMLVGPSGGGKSVLIIEAIRKLNESLAIVKSTTTREKRSVEDELFYDFVDFGDFLRKERESEFIEIIRYAGNYYGLLKKNADEVTSAKHGICATTEYGVIALMRAGYNVRAVKIISKHHKEYNDRLRAREDKERAKLHITYQKEIINSFKKSGKEKAAKELINYIKGFVR